MTAEQDSLLSLRDAQRRFAYERDWAVFHTPKNLAMALAGEVGEVLEHFQWLSEAQSQALEPEKRSEVAAELADVLLYLIRLADVLDIDLAAAAADKLRRNAERYPVDKVRGSAVKYKHIGS